MNAKKKKRWRCIAEVGQSMANSITLFRTRIIPNDSRQKSKAPSISANQLLFQGKCGQEMTLPPSFCWRSWMFSVLSCARVEQEKSPSCHLSGLSFLNFKGFKCGVTSFGDYRHSAEWSGHIQCGRGCLLFCLAITECKKRRKKKKAQLELNNGS